MRRAKRSHVGQVMVGCLLLVACSGGCCRPRHGVIFRGDWSLEMNRIPWLVSRTDAHDECSVSAVDCVGGRLPEGEMSARLPCGSPAAASPSADETSYYLRKGRDSSICRGCGQPTCAGSVQPANATESYLHPRFHPVPTGPVFLPRRESYAAIEENSHPHRSGTSAPLPPEIQVVPTPDLGPDEGWKAKSPPQGGAGAPGSSSSTSYWWDSSPARLLKACLAEDLEKMG